MENCTIYSHQLAFDQVVEIVKTKLPKAKVAVNDNGEQKSLEATIKGGFFSKSKTLKINYRQRLAPSYQLKEVNCGLTKNLAGMVNFIQSLPAQNEGIKDKFLCKVMAANSEMPFLAEPSINADFASVLTEIAQAQDAFIFAQPSPLFNQSNGQHFLDKSLNLILDTEGNCQIEDLSVRVDAKYHDQPKTAYTPEQEDRKTRSEALLQERGVKVNKHLPAVPASTDVELRNSAAIVDRAFALLIMAVKGEGLEQEHILKTVEGKKINSFSPKETRIYQTETLNDQDRAYATWRYESLYTLLWALGKVDELKYPSEICDVPAVVEAIFKPERAAFTDSVALRSKAEILEELDKTYRMHWACVDARIKGQPVSGNINPSVIYERHYALNWLTQHEGQEWDGVLTNT